MKIKEADYENQPLKSPMQRSSEIRIVFVGCDALYSLDYGGDNYGSRISYRKIEHIKPVLCWLCINRREFATPVAILFYTVLVMLPDTRRFCQPIPKQ